jgi:hypothetical protein
MKIIFILTIINMLFRSCTSFRMFNSNSMISSSKSFLVMKQRKTIAETSRFLASSSLGVKRAAFTGGAGSKDDFSYSNPSQPQSQDGGTSSAKVFSSYSIYKGKTALQLKPIMPTVSLNKQNGNRILTRDGALLMEFAPVLAATAASAASPISRGGGGQGNHREYDWSKKQYFSLNVNELGELCSFDRSKGMQFLHDPNLGGLLFSFLSFLSFFLLITLCYLLGEQAGLVTKTLKIAPTADGKGFVVFYFFLFSLFLFLLLFLFLCRFFLFLVCH